MKYEEKLDMLYNGIFQGNDLTTQELNNYGFNSKDINKLIEERKIERVQRGYYKFIDIDNYCEYTIKQAKKALSEKDYQKAYLYYKKCYEIAPYYIPAVYGVFVQEVMNNNYDVCIECLEKLLKTKNVYYQSDYNLYLYLLSIIKELPPKLISKAKSIEMKDVELTKTQRYKNIQEINRVRNLIISRHLAYALQTLNNIIREQKYLSYENIILKNLLLSALAQDELDKDKLLNLYEDKKYIQIANELNNKKQKCNLTNYEECVLILIEKLLLIQKNKQIPEIDIRYSNTVTEAIERNNFELAISMITKYNKNIANDNLVYALLNEICNEIEKNKIEEELKKQENNSNKLNIEFSNIINYLLQNNLDEAFESIRTYLKRVNKSEYEFIIINLIKLSVLEKDTTYSKSIITLTNIIKDDYKFDLSNYVQEFYLAISQNKLLTANIYLNIISEVQKLGIPCEFAENLKMILEKAKEEISKSTSSSITTNEKSEEKTNIESENKISNNNSLNETRNTSNVKKDVISNDVNELLQFMDDKNKKLLNSKGIILLKPMTKLRRRKIYDTVAENYPNIQAFSIGTGELKHVVLRYKAILDEPLNIPLLIEQGNNAYKSNNYDECIEKHLQLLSVGWPKSITYARLGLSYLKKFDKEKAIEYLKP